VTAIPSVLVTVTVISFRGEPSFYSGLPVLESNLRQTRKMHFYLISGEITTTSLASRSTRFVASSPDVPKAADLRTASAPGACDLSGLWSPQNRDLHSAIISCTARFAPTFSSTKHGETAYFRNQDHSGSTVSYPVRSMVFHVLTG
jgi:hypothetical protein